MEQINREQALLAIAVVSRAAIIIAIVALTSTTAWGADKTDVITLANGDRITGEIVGLSRGQLQLKTDDAGTIAIEWVKIARVQSIRQVEVATSDGRRFVGILDRTGDGFLQIIGTGMSLPIPEVIRITPIGVKFWKQLDGSLDAGFTYTHSSAVAQTTFNSDTVYRRPAFTAQLTGSATLTYTNDPGSPVSQGVANFSYMRYSGPRWVFGGSGRAETNESLGLLLRSQAAGFIGQRLVNTNRAQFVLGGGMDVNNEQGVDTAATQNVEGLLAVKASYYRYDTPKTNFDLSFQYYPSLSNWGRQRVQFNFNIKQDLVKDLYFSINTYDTFDSDPPNPNAANNDVGVVASIGWSFGR